MNKCFIKNRDDKNIAVVVEEHPNQTGLAFIMHGLGGFKEQPHIQAFTKSFIDQGMTAVLFDTTNTLGESDGTNEQATVTNYLADLEDVIEWASKQTWYQAPFWLAGHSLGGMCITLFAEKHPSKVAGLAPIAPVVSGELSIKSPQYSNNTDLEDWKTSGWRITESKSKPGFIKKLPWSHMEDRLTYDVLTKADTLTMPLFILTGSEDDGCPSEHQQLFFDAAPEPKEFHIVDGAPHTYTEPKHIEEVRALLSQWINRYLQNPD